MHRPSSTVLISVTLSSLVLATTGALVAYAQPQVSKLTRHEAADLVKEAATNPTEANVDYQLATRLDPSNQIAFLGLARGQIAAGNARAALATLAQAGEGSEVVRLRTRTLLELGRANEAVTQIQPLIAPHASDSDILLAACTYALSAQSDHITPLIPLVSSPEAARQLALIQTDETSLAIELYASGLPESSRRLLTSLPTSFTRNLLLGRLYYNRHTPSDLASATDFLTTAVALNPANLEAHQLLAAVYADRDLPVDSATQTALAQKLSDKKP